MLSSNTPQLTSKIEADDSNVSRNFKKNRNTYAVETSNKDETKNS